MRAVQILCVFLLIGVTWQQEQTQPQLLNAVIDNIKTINEKLGSIKTTLENSEYAPTPTIPPSTAGPTGGPTDSPTDAPTNGPTDNPTDSPTGGPTDNPTDSPTDGPTDNPTDGPSDSPTDNPTDGPTDNPTDGPTDSPTDNPSDSPSDAPTDTPTDSPTDSPTDNPSDSPSDSPSDAPTDTPTDSPTDSPTDNPSDSPSDSPSDAPTDAPTDAPSDAPSEAPSEAPSDAPTDAPSDPPSGAPSDAPTAFFMAVLETTEPSAVGSVDELLDVIEGASKTVKDIKLDEVTQANVDETNEAIQDLKDAEAFVSEPTNVERFTDDDFYDVFETIDTSADEVTAKEDAAKKKLASFGIPIDSPFFITLFTLGSLALVVLIVGFGITARINMNKKKRGGAKKQKVSKQSLNQMPPQNRPMPQQQDYEAYGGRPQRPLSRDSDFYQSRLGSRNNGPYNRPNSPSGPERTFSLVSEPGAQLLHESETRNPHHFGGQIPRAQGLRQSSKARPGSGYYNNSGSELY